MTNLITPRPLFSPTYLLNLAKPELAPFDPPTSKTPSYNQTLCKSDDPPLRYRHLNFPRWRPSRHLGFGGTGNSAIRSADPENLTVEPNMKWIGRPLAEIWPFEISPIWAKNFKKYHARLSLSTCKSNFIMITLNVLIFVRESKVYRLSILKCIKRNESHLRGTSTRLKRNEYTKYSYLPGCRGLSTQHVLTPPRMFFFVYSYLLQEV